MSIKILARLPKRSEIRLKNNFDEAKMRKFTFSHEILDTLILTGWLWLGKSRVKKQVRIQAGYHPPEAFAMVEPFPDIHQDKFLGSGMVFRISSISSFLQTISTMCISPPHSGHFNGSTSYIRQMNFLQLLR
ncbi:MAG: hypothetical protein AB1414_14260 [bacterium]